MRRIGLLVVLVAVAVGAWFVSTWALGLPAALPFGEEAGPPANAAATPPAPKSPADASGGSYRTEEEWVVTDIAAGLAGMAEYARTGGVSTAPVAAHSERTEFAATRDSGTFAVTVGPLRHTVTITSYLWSPDDYAGLALTLLGPQPAASAGTAIAPDRPSSILTNLTDPRVEVLIAEHTRLSAELKANMRSAIAHEEAALLLGAFMHRESAGDFDDSRSQLSRMTAHLAFAHALRGGASQPSIAARGAQALLLTWASRQREALQIVAVIEAAGDLPGAAAWARALRECITGDWRVAPPANASLFERIVHARARKRRLGEDRARDFIDAAADERERITDWERMILSGGFSVQSGNQLADRAVMREADEMTRVWAAYGKERRNYDVILGHLNDLPSPSPVLTLNGQTDVQVLDWGRWAAFLQRHLMAALNAEFQHARMLGWDDEMKGLAAKWEPQFGRLRLFPLLRRKAARDAPQYERAMRDGLALLGEHPELVNAPLWYRFLEHPPAHATAVPFPQLATWFMPLIPTGTVYQNSWRILNPIAPAEPSLAQLAHMTELAPYDQRAAYHRVWQETKGKPTVADGLRAFANIYDYDTSAAIWILNYMKGEPDEYVPVAQRLCDLDVDSCGRLGWQLVDVGQEAEAAKAFEKLATEGRDRVGIANNMDWVVQYYYDTGKRLRAGQLAQMAAATGSAGGLYTLAHLAERHEEYEQAEALYREMHERYASNTFDIGAFCLRHARRTGQKQYVDDAKTFLKDVIPQGLETLPAERPTTPPVDGVLITGVGGRAARIGLRNGDIIIGIDDVRVHHIGQYRLAMTLNESDYLKITVWRDNAYQDLSLQVPQRWFGVKLNNHTPPKPATPPSQ